LSAAISPTWTSGVPRVRHLWVIASIAIVGVAIALRFANLGEQSLWVDEAYTARLLDGSLGDLLSGVAERESTPPLYYVLVWAWAKVFGDTEVAMRSVSALAGVACVPVMYMVARTLIGRRAGAVAAALTATSSGLVWYSQEARAYSLWLLLTALALLCWLRALDAPTKRNLGLWAALSGLAICAHYLALAFVLPQAAWLLRRHLRRGAGVAVGAVALVALALAPLALHQRAHGGTDWISAIPVDERLKQTYWLFTTGANGSWDSLAPFVALLAEVAIVLALFRGPARVRRGAIVALCLASSAMGLFLVAGLMGSDYLVARNVLPCLPLLILAVAAAAESPGRVGVLGALIGVAICVAFVRQDVRIDTTAAMQRDDWRGAARALGRSPEPRVIVLGPGWVSPVLGYYLPDLRPMPAPRSTREVDLVIPYSAAGEAPRPPSGAFSVEAELWMQNWRIHVVRLRAPEPAQVEPSALTTEGFDGFQPFIEGG
jgi:mannosyltransferase